MNRQEFMRQLEELLNGISEEEREEALAYYRNYFEDAGIENEEKVLRELESPEKLAASIRAGLLEDGTDEYRSVAANGAFGYRSVPEDEAVAVRNTNNGTWENADFVKEESGNTRQNGSKSSDNTGMIVLAVVLLVVTSPVWLGFLVGLLGGIVGIMAGLFGTMVGLLAGGIACIGVGISYFVTANAPMGILALGCGILLISVGILALLGLVQICGRFLPWVIRGIGKLVRKIFQSNKKEERI